MEFFMSKPNEVLEELAVNSSSGLSEAQAAENIQKFGKNVFTKEKPPSLLKRFISALAEPMMIMLIVAAVITFGVNIFRLIQGGHADFVECVGIIVAILLSTLISVLMEGRSQKAFEALEKFNEDTVVKVIRDNTVKMIPIKNITVGDIVFVETGDKIPADGRLVECMSLNIDESSLTGESVPVEKNPNAVFENIRTPIAERKNMAYSGCFVTSGSGKMVVTAVGDNTEFGKIAKELTTHKESTTPLQEKLAKMSKYIAVFGVVAAVAVFAVQIVNAVMSNTLDFNKVLDIFIESIVLVVAAVPEGLPTIVAISLSYNVIKMSRQNALVKKMVACETIGSTNIICSDKTGTLTENKMTVAHVYQNNKIITPDKLSDSLLINNFSINSTADVTFKKKKKDYVGNPTECALLSSVYDSGYDYKDIRKAAYIAHSFPFSSDSKNMTTVVNDDGKLIAYTKGSPEKILEMCNLPLERKGIVENEIRRYQEKAYRVIAFAHKYVDELNDYEGNRKLIESDMVFDGFTAINDPIREDVYKAVERSKGAGIAIKMLTGDNITTAKAIANELKIFGKGQIAIEARELEDMSDEELKEALPKIAVIARSTPTVKMRVVTALKEMGNVVAVTGDGINDAPAIKNADIGIAMGITGTEVSKEASDVVLLDDSFSTIIRAVQWGRGIYENFQRFIQFQLTVNVASVLVILISVIAGGGSPFTALQILWINIIMDGPPAVTLGLEPIRGDLMNRKPVSRSSNILTGDMVLKIGINAVYMTAIFLLQSFTNFMGTTSQTEMSSVLFTLFVIFQLFNAFNSRELSQKSIFRNFASNKIMLIVFAVTFLLQIVITQFGGAFFNTTALSLVMWLKIIVLAFTVILISELTKQIVKMVRGKQNI